MNLSFYKNELEKIHTESFGWALRCCKHNTEEAEDVLQTAYLKIFEGKARFKQKSAFKTWWFAVIRNTAYDMNSQKQKGLSRMKSVQEHQKGMISGSAVDTMINHERSHIFKNALIRLSERQQQILQLVFYHELTIEKAAEVMQISVGSARTHYKRGKQNIKKILEKTDIRK